MSDKPLDQQLIDNLLGDRRSERRWRNIRFFGWLFILTIYAILIFGSFSGNFMKKSSNKPYVSLIRLNGMISANTSFSAKYILPALNKAFADKKSKGVVLVINSPGGSPVQASIIHDKIMELKKRYKKKVIVVGQDTLASGSYLVATAADKIYVNADTLTGSIGVIISGFGFVDAISKIGVTRRLFTAGVNKDRLDPFEKTNPADVDKIKNVLNVVHQNFINDVIAGRGDRLKGDRQSLFSGDFWTGSQAVKLGLVDGTANLWEAIKQEFNTRYFKDYSVKTSFIQTFIKSASSELKFNLMTHTSPIQTIAY